MGFFSAEKHLELMRQAPEFERVLVHAGVRRHKHWFSVTPQEQRRRLEERRADPFKRWNLRPIDIAGRGLWDECAEARQAEFFYIDGTDASWTGVKSSDRKRARLTCMRRFLSSLDHPGTDDSVVGGLDRPQDVRRDSEGGRSSCLDHVAPPVGSPVRGLSGARAGVVTRRRLHAIIASSSHMAPCRRTPPSSSDMGCRTHRPVGRHAGTRGTESPCGIKTEALEKT